jgi:excinuclease ABC subunit C
VFKRAGQVGRPCLLGYIDKCSAPCVGRVSAAEHRAIVDDFVDFMAGSTEKFVKRLERQMREAADEQAYERAARLRDDIGALRRANEKQAVVLGDGTDADVVAFAHDELEAAVQVFYVRGGRVRGQRGWVVDKVEPLDVPDLVEQFLSQEYLAGDPSGALDIPREVLVPQLPRDADVVAELLTLQRGARVELRVPQRGDKRALLETVARNAEQAFRLHKLKRASDISARSLALGEIQESLGLPEAPLRIECFDVSHVSGTDVVASMVVFEDGLARKSEYRRFALRGAASGDTHDDTAWMREVISRRFSRYLAERARSGDLDAAEETEDGTYIDPETGRPRKFAYPPNLVVVDGGPPQVAAAAAAMAELGIDDVSLCGLAKRLEEVWLPGREHPVLLSRSSEGLYLLQRIRDEAHRFAITYHRAKRSKSMVQSALDEVAGLGDARKRLLLRHFGSLKRLRAASVDEIASLPGLGPKTAQTVYDVLHADLGPGGSDESIAVDPLTGEILQT